MGYTSQLIFLSLSESELGNHSILGQGMRIAIQYFPSTAVFIFMHQILSGNIKIDRKCFLLAIYVAQKSIFYCCFCLIALNYSLKTLYIITYL